MKAKVLQPFTMGDRSYTKDQEVDFEESKVQRLVREGLVVAVSTPEPIKESPSPAPAQEQKAKAAESKKPRRKK